MNNSAALLKSNILGTSDTMFFLCDMQEKFRPAIFKFTEIIETSRRLVNASKILNIPLIVTEQYPKGLGQTVSELDIGHALGTFAKTKFSMCLPEIKALIKEKSIRTIVLFGVETHVCIQQTALDLLTEGVAVHLVADGTSSRSLTDRLFAIERLRQAGVIVTTHESVLFQLVGDKENPNFKEIQALVKDKGPDTGLFNIPSSI